MRSGYTGFINGERVDGTMPNTSITEGETTVNSDSATRGTWSQTAGYTSERILSTATFNNEATSGHTYVDISSTTSAPVLISGGYLYIDKGWTDDLKISLAKLVPDGSDVKGHSEYILSGHSAYDNDGALVAGSIPTLVASDITVSGPTITIPVAKYTGTSNATAITKTIGSGSYTSSVASQGTSTAAAFTPSLSGTITNIGTTTKPSGTDGTDYWTITPDGSKTNGIARAKATATISTAGYISEGSYTTPSYTTWTVTTNKNNGTPRYLAKASTSITNGTATATAGSASTTVTGMVTTTTNTGYSVSASATGGNASLTASSASVGIGYNPSAITASTTAQTATGTNASQTKYIQKGILRASVSSNIAGSASIAATGFTPLASGSSSYYVTLTTTPGSVKAKAQVGTEGYVKTEENETSATGVAVSGNNTKLYIPAGSATTPATTTTATIGINVNSSGLITATASGTKSVTPTVNAGYVASGTAGTITITGSNTSQLSVVAATTYTPTTTNQTISLGKYITGTQTILGDANLIPENIKNNVVLFGITGTHVGGQGVNVVETLDTHGGTIVTITSDAEVYGTAEEVAF